jgi:hypothetical protein
MKELIHGINRPSKDNVKLFVGNVGGLTVTNIEAAFKPTVLNDVQFLGSKAAFIFLNVDDAASILDKHPNGLKLSDARKIYPSAPKDAKDIAKLKAAQAKLASTSAVNKPSAAPAGMARTFKPVAPTVLKQLGNTNVNTLVTQTKSLASAPNPVCVEVSNLPPWAMENEVRCFFKSFELTKKLCG